MLKVIGSFKQFFLQSVVECVYLYSAYICVVYIYIYVYIYCTYISMHNDVLENKTGKISNKAKLI